MKGYLIICLLGIENVFLMSCERFNIFSLDILKY